MASMEVITETLLYDFNNLMGDAGGLLGLLLGTSVLGLYGCVADWIQRKVERRQPRSETIKVGRK